MSTQSWALGSIGAWTSDSDWSPGPAPSAGDTALIAAGDDLIEVTDSVDITSVTIDDPTALLDIKGILDVSGGLRLSAGEIDVSGYLVTGALTNDGTIINGGAVIIDGNVDATSLRRIQGGTISVSGTLDNTGAVLEATQAAQLGCNDWGEVVGGTLDNVSIAGQATLSSVTVAGTLGVTVADSLTPFDPSLHIQLGGGDLVFGAASTLSGTVSGAGMIDAAGTLTLGPDTLIDNSVVATFGDSILHLTGGTIVNDGTILGANAGYQIGVGNYQPWLLGGIDYQSADFINDGVLGLANDIVSSATFINAAGGTMALDQVQASVSAAAAIAFTNDGLITNATQTGGLIDIAAPVTGSGTIDITSGATVVLDGAVSASQTLLFAGTGLLSLGLPRFVKARIEGFGPGDTLVLAGSMIPISLTDGDLKLLSNGLTIDLALSSALDLSDLAFAATDSETTLVLASHVSCFAKGSRIAGPDGQARPVEDLTPGEVIMTGSGAARPILWIGRRAIDCTRHPAPHAVWPIRIRAGAFAEAAPLRDLYLSPDQAVLAGDVLIQIGRLCNGTTIAQQPVAQITYYHIKLETHDVLLAEGLAVETYLDTGGRDNFQADAVLLRLHPDFGVGTTGAGDPWELHGSAPMVLAGPRLEQERQRLAARTAALACDAVLQAVWG